MRAIRAFLLGAMCVGNFAASSTQFYGVALGKRYTQTGTSAPALLPTQAYSGRAFVYSTATTSATVKRPTGVSVSLVNQGSRWEVSGLYDAPIAQAGSWPAGNYVITNVNSIDGTKVSQMNLSSDLYPNATRISNFNEAQSIYAPETFLLKWDTQAALGTNFIYLRIEEGATLIFETSPIPGKANSLNATANATGFNIPAGTLQQGRVYTARVTVWRGIIFDTASNPGALGETAYTCETSLTIRTRWNVQDVRAYGVEKRVNYHQTGASPSLPASPFEVVSFASGSASDSMSAASFRPVSGAYRNLAPSGSDFGFAESFATQGAMEGAYVAGNYEVRMSTKNNGTRAIANALAGNTYPPGPPQIANIDDAQLIKPGQSFTLSWNMTEANTSDLIQVIVTDGSTVVFATPQVASSGSLNGGHRSISIPAGVLAPAKAYTGYLRWARLTATDSVTYPTAIGQWSYARVTRFPLQTASGSSSAAFLNVPARIGNQTQLSFSSIRGEKYTIYTSPDLTSWILSQTVTGSTDSTTILLPANPAPISFYRVGAGP